MVVVVAVVAVVVPQGNPKMFVLGCVGCIFSLVLFGEEPSCRLEERGGRVLGGVCMLNCD